MKSLQGELSRLVSEPEPSTEGTWYGILREELPLGWLEFHFNDEGNLTEVRMCNRNGEPFASSEVKLE